MLRKKLDRMISTPSVSDVIEGMTTRNVRVGSRLPNDLAPRSIDDADESLTGSDRCDIDLRLRARARIVLAMAFPI
jgi:hypothetical protein